MRKRRWQLLHINHIQEDIGAPVRLHQLFCFCIKEMTGMSLAGLLAKHRCAFAAVVTLVGLSGGNCILSINEQLIE